MSTAVVCDNCGKVIDRLPYQIAFPMGVSVDPKDKPTYLVTKDFCSFSCVRAFAEHQEDV